MGAFCVVAWCCVAEPGLQRGFAFQGRAQGLFDFLSMKTRFILIETSHAGNVGAAARALKTMGFDDLVLVRPRYQNVLRKEETIQRASGASSLDGHVEHGVQGVRHRL